MADNSRLYDAKNAKKDEFYTELSDIQQELWHYENYFKGATIFCNCDDPFESNFYFFFFFASGFKHLGLKRLISTCYDGSSIAGT